MPDTLTANYEFVKVEIGGSDNTWGNKLNSDMDAIDATIAELDGRLVAAKVTPVDADFFGYYDSEAANALKKFTWAQFKTAFSAALSVTDSTFEIKDNADPTKIAKFELSGLSTGLTRTYTMPNASTTLVGTDVGQILTNKTVTTPILTLNQASLLPTLQGDIRWDNTNKRMIVGNGTTQIYFGSGPTTTVDNTIPRYNGVKGELQTSGVVINDSNDLSGINIVTTAQLFIGAQQNGYVSLSAVTTDAGTSIPFSVPATVRKIRVVLDKVKVNGTSPLIIQLGDSGGYETSGYEGSIAGISGSFTTTSNHSTGILVGTGVNPDDEVSGIIELNRISGNKWVASFNFSLSNQDYVFVGTARKETSAATDRLRLITVSGAPIFTSGSAKVEYEY